MSVRLSLSKNRVELRAPWRPTMADECKTVPGARWAPSKNAWTYPLSMATLRALRSTFGKELKISPELNAWAKVERVRERRLKSYATVHDASLRLVPDLAPTLAVAMQERTYQRSAARFAAATNDGFLLADEPGLGKTASTLAGIIESGLIAGSHLVIAPKTSLESTWGRQIRMWIGELEPSVHVFPEGAQKRSAALSAFFADQSGVKFLVLNPAAVRRLYGRFCRKCEVWEEDVKAEKVALPVGHHIEDGHKWSRTVRSEAYREILDYPWTTVTLDESHELLASYSPSNVTQSVQGLLDISAEKKFALSGTPLRGQERHIWGSLDWLGANTGGYWSFVESYMEVRKGYFGTEVYGLDPSRSVEFHRLVDRYVLRRTRSEVRPELPIGQRNDVLVQMDASHSRQYEAFRKDGEAELASGMLFGKGLLSELTRLKQLSFGLWEDRNGKLTPTLKSPKFEWLMQFLSDRGITGTKAAWLPEPGEAYKYVVASQFKEILDMLHAELGRKGIPSLMVTGDVTGKKRTSAVEQFQSDDAAFRVMLLQTQTGGVSIDLDAWCDEMVILDETFVADDQVQLEGRINNRSGRVAPRTWWYLRTADTIEERIGEGNHSQHVTEHNLLDARRGVETALHLIRKEH